MTTKPIVFVMMRYSFFVLCFLMVLSVFGQNPEREHRILKRQFPTELAQSFEQAIDAVRKVRYYKEIDTQGDVYGVRFKRNRLWYHMQWNTEKQPQRLGFQIEEVDFPTEVYDRVIEEVNANEKPKVRRMYQYYPLRATQVSQDLRTALQNSLVAYLQYEVWIRTKVADTRKDMIYTFDAQGQLLSKNEALPANYDHVLY